MGALREANKQLKDKLLGLEGLVNNIGESIDFNQHDNSQLSSVQLEAKARGLSAVQDSITVIEACKKECLRTFREDPNSPEIPLKYVNRTPKK